MLVSSWSGAIFSCIRNSLAYKPHFAFKPHPSFEKMKNRKMVRLIFPEIRYIISASKQKLGQNGYCGRNRSIVKVMNRKLEWYTGTPCLVPKPKMLMLHTLLSAVLLFASRSLLLIMLSAIINRSELQFFSLLYQGFLRFLVQLKIKKKIKKWLLVTSHEKKRPTHWKVTKWHPCKRWIRLFIVHLVRAHNATSWEVSPHHIQNLKIEFEWFDCASVVVLNWAANIFN